MSLVEVINKISSTMDDLLNFVANNKEASGDFEKFLQINNIEIKTEEQLNKLILYYILEGEMQDGTRVIDYYTQVAKKFDKKLVASFRDSYYSIFHIKKVHKNSYETYCLTNERDFELIPLVKTSTLRSIGMKDYIVGRIFEFKGDYYLLGIDDVISSNDNRFALAQGVKYLVKNPEKIYWQNPQKLEEFKEIVDIMTKSFKKCMGGGTVVTTNKLADHLLEYFNNYHHNLLKDEKLEDLINLPEKYGYFDVGEFKDIQTVNDEYFENAAGGFSTHKCTYDVGFWVDDELGIFIIPFLGTFFEIFKVKTEVERNEILNWQQCVIEFLNSPKIPPSVLLGAGKNLVKVVNTVLDSDYKSAEEIVAKYKNNYLSVKKFSPTIVLYNSNVFFELLEYLQDTNEEPKPVGRNEICPCGSGKKYKKCCLK